MGGVTGTSQLGSTDALTASQTQYPYWQVVNDTWNLGTAAATGQVLLNRGQPTIQRPTADPNDASFSGQLATARTAIPTTVPGKDDISSVTDAVSMLYRYPPDKLADLANRMYAAGFYPPQSYA